MLRLLLLPLALALPALATAQTAVVRTDEVRAELVAHAPEGVVPGDTLLFTTSYRNEGASAVDNFVIINPVPADLVLTDEAAAANDVSVDGSKTWGRLADLKIVNEDGEERPATIEDITHMRWVFARVAPTANGEVTFSARVR